MQERSLRASELLIEKQCVEEDEARWRALTRMVRPPGATFPSPLNLFAAFIAWLPPDRLAGYAYRDGYGQGEVHGAPPRSQGAARGRKRRVFRETWCETRGGGGGGAGGSRSPVFQFRRVQRDHAAPRPAVPAPVQGFALVFTNCARIRVHPPRFPAG